MSRLALLAPVLILGASAASAGLVLTNDRDFNGIQLNMETPGSAASVVVQAITLADGTVLVVEPAR